MDGCTLAVFFFFQAEDGIRDLTVTGVQTCALPILKRTCPERADGRLGCFQLGDDFVATHGGFIIDRVSSDYALWPVAAIAGGRSESMHQVTMPQPIVEGVVEKRRNGHAFDAVDPARTAPIAVDLPRDFMPPGAA